MDDPRQPPDAGGRRDLDGAGATGRDRQAAVREPGHRRRLRQQDHAASSVHRVLPPRPQAQPAGAVDGVADRSAHGEHTWERAHVPRRHRPREGGRDDARLLRSRDRRLRGIPALRAARLHHLGAGDAGLLPLAEHPRRLHPGLHEQVAGCAEPWLLAHAASLADRADRRHRGGRARPRPDRGAQEELRQAGRVPLRDAERVRLRLGRLRPLPRHRARPDRLLLPRGEAERRRVAGQALRHRHRLHARLRARTTSASR